MGELGQDQCFKSEKALLQYSDATFKIPLSPLVIHIDPHNSQVHPSPSPPQQDEHQHQHPDLKDEWLPITESRNGNAYSAAFHILNSNIGFQALMLPVAFGTLGWAWGTICLSIAFVWQLYTILLLIRLQESIPGIRHSRFLFLAMAAFGKKLGKVAALFPVMYLSGGSCVMLIITGGGTLKLLSKTVCGESQCRSASVSGVEWLLVFTCVAIVVAQLPSLNSMAVVSLIGAVAAVTYCTLFWALSVKKGRVPGVSYSPSPNITGVLNAIGILFLSFRGHNLVLEIQGTLPKQACGEAMRRGVSVSYALIGACVYPLAIAGFWAYGNQIGEGGLLTAFGEFHGRQVTKLSMGGMYGLIIIHCVSSFQVYAMPVFDNLEIRYTSVKNKKCPPLVRACIRILFGGFTFFIAVAFPFLPTLAALLGGITLVPLTYAYPCFMWFALKKPRKLSHCCFNLLLGCLGMLLAALLVAAALRTLALHGLKPNFFKP